ncbi:MAG: hypothetical protein ACFFF9_04940 [Candidatus Thorarchaeota archaeon]
MAEDKVVKDSLSSSEKRKKTRSRFTCQSQCIDDIVEYHNPNNMVIV